MYLCKTKKENLNTMKRIILIAILLIATQQYAVAQLNTTPHDTVYGLKERIYSVHWYDTCQEFLNDTIPTKQTYFYRLGIAGSENLHLTKHYTPHRIAVKGLACMVMRPEEMEIMRRRGAMTGSLSDRNLPQYLQLYKQVDTGLVLLGTTERYDTIAPTLMEIPLIASGDTTTFCHLYEAYFKSPVYVDSEFFVSSTSYGNGPVFVPEYGDLVHLYRQIWHVSIQNDGNLQVIRGGFECNYPWSVFYYYTGRTPHALEEYNYRRKDWGPFFPIVDFYNITTESANPAQGSTSGDGRFSDLTDVVITATPEPGYRFRRWNDGNTRNPRTVFLTQDTHFIAYFTDSIPLQLTAIPDHQFNGQVTGGGAFWYGDTATLTVIPADRYRFTHWNDGDTANPRTVVVTQDTLFTAYFEWIDQHEGITAPDAKAPLFTLTPNPARSSVTVTINPQLSILNSQLSMTLTDAAGRELLNTKVTTLNFQLSLSQYPAGTYFVTLRTPDATSTQRLVIK